MSNHRDRVFNGLLLVIELFDLMRHWHDSVVDTVTVTVTVTTARDDDARTSIDGAIMMIIMIM